jgi:Ser/Thr protein kinase RdoA (MazF antagonist)
VANTPEAFGQAGELTRRLHDSAPAIPLHDFADSLLTQMDSWLNRMPGIVDPTDVDHARGRVQELRQLPPTYSVRCHGDNQPRNWLVDDDGTVTLIDFGRAQVAVWLRDLERMYFKEWYENPALQDAFLEGYGCVLDDLDIARLRGIGAAGSIGGRLWAREHHNPAFEQHHIETLDRIRAGRR